MEKIFKAITLGLAVVLLAAKCTSTQCPPCPPEVPGDTLPTPPVAGDLGNFVGSNCFTWTPQNDLPLHRIYLRWEFVATERGLFVEPIFKSRTADGKGLDTYIADISAKGGTAVLCVNQTPDWFWGGSASGLGDGFLAAGEKERTGAYKSYPRRSTAPMAGKSPDHPPVLDGKSRTDPKSYARFASDLGELAKRYGSKKHAFCRVDGRSRWTNDPPNIAKSGLGYNVVVEVWNEPDKWWHKGNGSGIYMEAEEYAAMLSACYDSIKAADPTMPVAMGGLTNFDLNYLRAMGAWFAVNRPDGNFAADIVNVHHYSHYGNRQGVHPPTWFDGGACPPELDQDFSGIFKIMDFAKPLGLPVWASEFGTDTRPPSWMYAAPTGGKNSEQLQAEWAVRSYLEYTKAGVSAAFIFNGNDEVSAPNGGLYASSGLLYGEGQPGLVFAPKPAFAFVNSLSAFLKGKAFVKDVSGQGFRALQFKDGNGAAWYAAWVGDAAGAVKQILLGGKTVSISGAPVYFKGQ